MSALRDEQPNGGFDVNAAIRREVEKAYLASGGEPIPVPSIVADKLVKTVPVDAKVQHFDRWLRAHVRELIKDDRKPVEVEGTRIKKAGAPNQRWTAAVFNKSFNVGDTLYLRLGDFTVEHCESIAEDYAARKRQNAAWEKRFRKLSEAIREAGVVHARELGADTLKALGF
jgi:hypothetical protein